MRRMGVVGLMVTAVMLVACGGSQAATVRQPTPQPALTATIRPTPPPTFTPFNPAPVVATLEAAQTAEDWLLAADMSDVLLKADPHNERLQDIRANALMMVGDKAMAQGDTREAARRWEMARSVKPHPVIEDRLRALTPTATIAPTATPAPTALPTNTAQPPIRPAAIFRQWNTLTELQRQSFEKQAVGTLVGDTCTLREVTSEGNIYLDCTDNILDTVVLQGVSKTEAAQWRKGQRLAFAGRITQLSVFMFNYMYVANVGVR